MLEIIVSFYEKNCFWREEGEEGWAFEAPFGIKITWLLAKIFEKCLMFQARFEKKYFGGWRPEFVTAFGIKIIWKSKIMLGHLWYLFESKSHLIIDLKSGKMLDYRPKVEKYPIICDYFLGSKAQLIVGQKNLKNARYYSCVLRIQINFRGLGCLSIWDNLWD